MTNNKKTDSFTPNLDLEKQPVPFSWAPANQQASRRRRRNCAIAIFAVVAIAVGTYLALWLTWADTPIMLDFITITQSLAADSGTAFSAQISIMNTRSEQIEVNSFPVEVLARDTGNSLLTLTIPGSVTLPPFKAIRLNVTLDADGIAPVLQFCGNGPVQPRQAVVMNGKVAVQGWRSLLPHLSVSSRLSDIPCPTVASPNGPTLLKKVKGV